MRSICGVVSVPAVKHFHESPTVPVMRGVSLLQGLLDEVATDEKQQRRQS